MKNTKSKQDIIKEKIGDSYDIIRKKTLMDGFVIAENDLPISSIIKENNLDCSQRWTPKSVGSYSPKIIIDCSEEWEKKIKDNIIYNLQYIEYLQKQLDELILRDPIKRILNKTYLITSVAIIEGFFTYFLKKNGLYNYEEWKSFKKEKKENSPIEIIDGKNVKKEIEYFEKVNKYEIPMTLDSMIKRIKDKNLIDFGNEDIFKELNSNRNLRNEIHLFAISDYKTDYLTFNDDTQKMIKKLLYVIITNKVFFLGDEREKLILFDFLLDKDDLQ